MVGEVGLEPTKAKPADLQSAPFAARDTPPIQPILPNASALKERGGLARKDPGKPGPDRARLILRAALPCQPKKRLARRGGDAPLSLTIQIGLSEPRGATRRGARSQA